MMDGHLLQTNKRFEQLKKKQKQKISGWIMYTLTQEDKLNN